MPQIRGRRFLHLFLLPPGGPPRPRGPASLAGRFTYTQQNVVETTYSISRPGQKSFLLLSSLHPLPAQHRASKGDLPDSGGLVESRGARGLGAQMTAWSRVPAQPALQCHKQEIHTVWVKPLQLGPVVTAVNIPRLIRDIYTSDKTGEKNLRRFYRRAISDKT